jgi:hypothetical protein
MLKFKKARMSYRSDLKIEAVVECLHGKENKQTMRKRSVAKKMTPKRKGGAEKSGFQAVLSGYQFRFGALYQ